jgi:hypothetical protein
VPFFSPFDLINHIADLLTKNRVNNVVGFGLLKAELSAAVIVSVRI